jgi:hypothetical protein
MGKRWEKKELERMREFAFLRIREFALLHHEKMALGTSCFNNT